MKLVFIFGDAAVGKMTVGQELIKITDLRLFYNHMTIEPVLEIFGERNDPAIDRMRWVVLEEFAKTDLEGLIFTMMWDLDDPADWAYAQGLQAECEGVQRLAGGGGHPPPLCQPGGGDPLPPLHQNRQHRPAS